MLLKVRQIRHELSLLARSVQETYFIAACLWFGKLIIKKPDKTSCSFVNVKKKYVILREVCGQTCPSVSASVGPALVEMMCERDRRSQVGV